MAPPAPGQGGGDGVEEVWIIAEHVEGHKVGEEVTVPAGAPQDASNALIDTCYRLLG